LAREKVGSSNCSKSEKTDDKMDIVGNLVDIAAREIYCAKVIVQGSRISAVQRLGTAKPDLHFLLPGFVDSHIHIESSMLVPSEFARLAVRHGTVATVSDPHEIANVMGIEGIEFMIADGQRVPFKFCFGAPSCVPATVFETAGATIDSAAVSQLLQRSDIYYLAEMMNYPGVLQGDDEVLKKLQAAKLAGKPTDGHAPALVGDDAIHYIAAGISTDHECTTLDEARHKLTHGMKIQIREGSAAKNFEALYPLIDTHPQSVMLCSDDKHPDDLVLGHINALVRRAVACGCDLFNALQAACWNPVDHYRLPVGRLSVGDAADFIVIDDLRSWTVQQTYIDGTLVYDQGRVLFERVPTPVLNHFQCSNKRPTDFALPRSTTETLVMEAIDGALLTGYKQAKPSECGGLSTLAVVNRYRDANVSKCLIDGFGITGGAIASCVAHDSHNILAVGSDQNSLCRAVNLVIENRGGIAAVAGHEQRALALPIAGIMSADDGEQVAAQYQAIDRFAKEVLRTPLQAPFMTLSFMALLVIPSLKLSDRGLFDVTNFQFVEVS
jgi:adenine deaminase